MLDRKSVKKTVRVSDPECWYGEDTVTVELYIAPPYKGEVRVRIVVHTIDDFSVVYERIHSAKYPTCVLGDYEHMKRWMFDTIPEEVNLNWFYRHGYVNN